MKKKIVYTVFAVAGLLVMSCVGETATTSEITAIDGKEIYSRNCRNCHGDDGKLGLSLAADLSKSALSVDRKKYIITNGQGAMMPFGDMLSTEEIEAVAAYCQTLKK